MEDNVLVSSKIHGRSKKHNSQKGIV
ncbi:hypothetical protein EE612_053307 [Oryza sativa]|nr:hypothetical protein EE612_053307 [Oryza sativa]